MVHLREMIAESCFKKLIHSVIFVLKSIKVLSAHIPTLMTLVTSCYGTNLHKNFKHNIAKFKREYLKLNISVTPKGYAVFYHVVEFCDW